MLIGSGKRTRRVGHPWRTLGVVATVKSQRRRTMIGVGASLNRGVGAAGWEDLQSRRMIEARPMRRRLFFSPGVQREGQTGSMCLSVFNRLVLMRTVDTLFYFPSEVF